MTIQQRVEQIYETERDRIYSYLLTFHLAPERAQELAQDAFLRLYLQMKKGDAIDNPRAWLYRVAHNLALRARSRDSRFGPLEAEAAHTDGRPNPESVLIERSRQAVLRRAVLDLSPQQRNCLHLRVQGLRYREIADVLGISMSAVGEFLRRAAVRLKEAVNE